MKIRQSFVSNSSSSSFILLVEKEEYDEKIKQFEKELSYYINYIKRNTDIKFYKNLNIYIIEDKIETMYGPSYDSKYGYHSELKRFIELLTPGTFDITEEWF